MIKLHSSCYSIPQFTAVWMLKFEGIKKLEGFHMTYARRKV